MFSFNNILHIVFASALAILFVFLTIHMVILCVKKKFSRKAPDVLFSIFLWIMLLVLLFMVALTVLISYLSIKYTEFTIFSITFSISSAQIGVTLESGAGFMQYFRGEVYTILKLLACQILVGACFVMTLLNLILHGVKCKSKKWFAKKEEREAKVATQQIKDELLDGDDKKKEEHLSGLDDIVLGDEKADYLVQLGDVEIEQVSDSDAVADKQEIESDIVTEQETIGQLATKLDKEEIDNSTGISDEEILPRFDDVPSSKDYFNDSYALESDEDDAVEEVDDHSLSADYFNDDYLDEAEDEEVEHEIFMQDEPIVKQVADTQDLAEPEPIVPLEPVIIEEPKVKKPRVKRDVKAEVRKINSSSVKKTGKHVVINNRANASKMFSEYLNSKDDESKKEIEQSIKVVKIK